jgi:hypothetical protein
MASPLGTSADRLDRLEDLLGLAVTVPYGVTRTVKSVTAATYTVIPSDVYKVLAFSHATPTVTIDSNANQPVPLGADIIMLGLNGPIILAAGSGVSIFGVNGVTVIGQNAPSRFIHQAANSWYLQASRGGDTTTIAINASGQFAVVSGVFAPVASPTLTGTATTPALNVSGTAGAGFEDLVSQSTRPAAGAATHARVWVETVAGREMLFTRSATGVAYPLSPHPTGKRWRLSSAQSSTSIRSSGFGAAPTSLGGTLSTPVVNSTRGLRTNAATTGGINSGSGWGMAVTEILRGAPSDLYGGFFYQARIAFPDASYAAGGASTGTRFFAGMHNGPMATFAAADRGGLSAHFCGFGYSNVNGGTTDTQFQFYSHDGSGTATNVTSTGVTLTQNHVYLFTVWCPVGATTITFRCDDLTAATTSGDLTTTTTLPGATTAMNVVAWVWTIDAVTRNIEIDYIYDENDNG